MPVKLSKNLKDKLRASGVGSALREYEDRYRSAKRGGLEKRKSDYKAVHRSLLRLGYGFL